jgi:hypothetical protein
VTNEDELGADWILEPAPWREIAVQRAHMHAPLIDASWRGAPITIVAPSVIEEWSATTQAALFPTTNLNAQIVDLPATFEAEGLNGPLPRNALVIKNCAGIQIGNENSQTNIHKFRVEDVRITLDKALARKLAASVPASPLATGHTKVSLWNSRGVQVGDFNRQRNVFRHVVTGPEIPLKLGDSTIVDKLRDGQTAAAERELLTMVRQQFERDAEPLYAALDVTCNENRPVSPEVLTDTVTSAYGHDNEQKIRERIDVVGLDLIGLLDAVGELAQPRGALKEIPVEFEPVEPLPPPPPPPPLPPPIRTPLNGPGKGWFF